MKSKQNECLMLLNLHCWWKKRRISPCQDLKCALSQSLGLTGESATAEEDRYLVCLVFLFCLVFWLNETNQMNQTDRACLDVLPKRWSMRVTPLFPNPLPVCLFAGPQARSVVRRLPHQLARSMQVKRRVGDCSGKPHPAVTVGS